MFDHLRGPVINNKRKGQDWQFQWLHSPNFGVPLASLTRVYSLTPSPLLIGSRVFAFI